MLSVRAEQWLHMAATSRRNSANYTGAARRGATKHTAPQIQAKRAGCASHSLHQILEDDLISMHLHVHVTDASAPPKFKHLFI